MGNCHRTDVVSGFRNVRDLLRTLFGGKCTSYLSKTVAFKPYAGLRVTELKPKGPFLITRTQWYCSWVLCFVTAGTFPASGESHKLGRVPVIPNAAGLTVDVSVEAVGGQGYQPVYLDVRPVGQQFNRDRRIGVTISPRAAYGSAVAFDYQTELFIPESASKHEQTVLVPYYDRWDDLTVHLTEEGKSLPGGRRRFHPGNALRTCDAGQVVTVGVLLPQDSKRKKAAWEKCPDVRGLITILGNGPLPEGKKRGASIHRLDHQAALGLLHEVQPAFVQFRPVKEDRLPTQWLEYSQLDLLLIPSPLLNRIRAEQPESFQAIFDWIATGGNVWVYATNTEAMTWIPTDQITTLPPSRVPDSAKVKKQLSLETGNDTSKLTRAYDSMVVKESTYSASQTFKKRSDVFRELTGAKHPLAAMEKSAAVANRIGYTTYGLGMVITIADDDPFPGSFQFWQALVEQNSLDQLTLKTRVGVDVTAGNVNYWNWLIPAVGQPPVKSFVFLNAFFALLIGPLSYFYFRRKQRLYLLYFFAPLMALLATMGLFVYALISDGTETMVRAHQLTWLDHQNAQMIHHDRQTYFPVMAEEPGISVQSDFTFFPVHHSPSGSYNPYYSQQSNNTLGNIVCSENEQSFRGQFFSPRRQRQYISVGITKNELPEKPGVLNFRPADAVISSALPFNIDQLVIRDTQGQYWLTDNLTSGGSQKMQLTDLRAVSDSLRPFQPSPTAIPNLQQTYLGGYYGQSTGTQVNLLERRFREWVEKGMPTGSFLAITPIDTDRVGLQQYRLVDSVHVVMGLLP